MERVTRGVADRVLHEERHAAQRAVGEGRCAGLGARSFEALVDDGVERGIDRFDASDCRVDELGGGHLAARDHLGLSRRVEPRQRIGHGQSV